MLRQVLLRSSLLVLLCGCSLLPVQRPWQVKVLSATTSEDWETYYVEEDSNDYMIVLEIEYSNLRSDTVAFSPESVVLVHTGVDETGWCETPALHKSGSSTQVTDFYEESVMYSVAAGETRTDTFVFEFPRGYVEFILYFPESEAIPITLTTEGASYLSGGTTPTVSRMLA